MAQLVGELQIVTSHRPETCERETKDGDYLSMEYVGKIDESSPTGQKGEVFDSSSKQGKPFGFTLGRMQVISGWDQGLKGMCVGKPQFKFLGFHSLFMNLGEKRTLIIPSELAYVNQLSRLNLIIHPFLDMGLKELVMSYLAMPLSTLRLN